MVDYSKKIEGFNNNERFYFIVKLYDVAITDENNFAIDKCEVDIKNKDKKKTEASITVNMFYSVSKQILRRIIL